MHTSHGLSALPTNRTLARIEVFFASAELRQKKITNACFAGKIDFFDKQKYRSE